MRASDPPVQYLVGTPKGRLSRLEKDLLGKPWQQARDGVQVKLLAVDSELYVFAESVDRVTKERAMRRRQLKWLWKRLRELAAMEISREGMLMKVGAARSRAPTAWRLIEIDMDKESSMFIYTLNRQKLRKARRREGRYLLRTNLAANDPALLWQYYVQLVAVEQAFKNLKGDLAIRPVFHQDERRIEAHIFIAFLAYCLKVTLQRRLHALAPGLTARSALEKFAAVQMIDVHLPTTDGRQLLLTRYTQPEPELQLLIEQLKLQLPPQPPPKITAAAVARATDVVKTFSSNSLITNEWTPLKTANPRRRTNVPGAVTARYAGRREESGATEPRPGRDILPPSAGRNCWRLRRGRATPAQSKSRSFFQTACMMTASLRATATVARRRPIRAASARPQLRSVLSVTLRVRMAFAAWNR